MELQPYSPGPPLSPYVQAIWVVRGTPSYRREKVLPNGVVELIYNLGSPHKVIDPEDASRFELYRESWISGMQERFIVIEAVEGFDLVGIRFNPEGAYRFLGMPVSEITNRVVAGEAILDRGTQELGERLAETGSLRGRLRLVELFLLERLAAGRAAEPWVAAVAERLRRTEEAVSIAELSRWIGVSHKHLVHRCKEQLGVAPKLLQRIHRLQAVIEGVRSQSSVDWAGVALDCGYFDQAHLNRDFRLLAGATPGQYLKARDDDENHLIVS